MPLETGDPAPPFTAATDGGGTLSLADFRGRRLVLYFYPKDATPGCTTEAEDFRDARAELDSLGAAVVGVSRDSVRRHDNFRKKHGLNFPLVSDADGALCEAYGVWVLKKNYGREYMGIERTTFLIGGDGRIARIWRKVRVKGHVAEVLDAVRAP